MTTEQRFSADMDRYFARKEREKFQCCRLAMSTALLGMGMQRWCSSVTSFTCPTCETRWERKPEPEIGWNLIEC
jgi:hypothetical protein